LGTLVGTFLNSKNGYAAEVRAVRSEKRRWLKAELIAAKRKEGLSRSTINNILAPLRGMYNQAREDEDIHRNPAERMGKFNKNRGRPPINPLTREELQIFLDKVLEEEPHYYPLFLCASRTGLRQGELIALKGIDLDFNGRFIGVERNLSRGQITTPKNGKSRRVDMSKQLAGVLDELLSKRRAAALRDEMAKPVSEQRDGTAVFNAVMEDWLFTTVRGCQINPANLLKLFYKLLTRAKLRRRMRFHDLRHTFASLLLEQGESPAYVRDQMGHSSIKITVDVYGHLVPGGNRQAVDRLDARVEVDPEKKSGVETKRGNMDPLSEGEKLLNADDDGTLSTDLRTDTFSVCPRPTVCVAATSCGPIEGDSSGHPIYCGDNL
jgi:integrase